ncbi:unnamed protein product, partial [Iphiclides podalirius]
MAPRGALVADRPARFPPRRRDVPRLRRARGAGCGRGSGRCAQKPRRRLESARRRPLMTVIKINLHREGRAAELNSLAATRHPTVSTPSPTTSTPRHALPTHHAPPAPLDGCNPHAGDARSSQRDMWCTITS